MKKRTNKRESEQARDDMPTKAPSSSFSPPGCATDTAVDRAGMGLARAPEGNPWKSLSKSAPV